DLSPVRLFAANTAYSAAEEMPESSLLAPIAAIMRVESSSIRGTSAEGRAAFRTVRGGTVHAFAVGFRAALAPGVIVSNDWPTRTPSWERGVLPLDRPVDVAPDTPIELELATENGRAWHWRGRIGDAAFDQTTLLSRPPCILTKQTL